MKKLIVQSSRSSQRHSPLSALLYPIRPRSHKFFSGDMMMYLRLLAITVSLLLLPAVTIAQSVATGTITGVGQRLVRGCASRCDGRSASPALDRKGPDRRSPTLRECTALSICGPAPISVTFTLARLHHAAS